jgi:4-amino-4-deoxy-L-arabinose transferase-like glycosyltransferase
MNRVRHTIVFAAVALIGAGIIVRLVGAPNYPDAYYHFNAAARLASGAGLTDTYLWTYIGAPESGVLYPSHLYWMPLTSLIGALGMALSGAPGSHAAAQLLFIPMLTGTAGIGFALGWQLGKSTRHAWAAGLIALFSGYFVRFWGAMDTFTPFALVGALCLLLAGRVTAGKSRWWIALLAGVCAGLGHLTRADGVLLLLTAGFVWLVSRRPIRLLVISFLGYLIVMMPWFARNLMEIGSPLPLGGTMTIWIREYNELFSFPPTASPAGLFADGLSSFAATRWEAFVNNLGTFIAVEGMIAMTPLMLIALWRRRRDPFLRPFWLYALGLHAAMTIVFPFPGYRGGLFHSAAALVPWWAALGVLGVDDAVDWLAKRRRWRPQTAKWVFSTALVGLALMLSLMLGSAGRVAPDVPTPALYMALDAALPSDARVMINDPAGLYYHTGRGGVVLPNSQPDVIPEIAARYRVDYLVLESPEAVPAPLLTLFDTAPDFLIPIPFDGGARVYAIALD